MKIPTTIFTKKVWMYHFSNFIATVFAASILLYHQCCAALPCIAPPMLHYNLNCVAEISSLVCVSVRPISILSNILI